MWCFFVEQDIDIGNNGACGRGGHWSLIWLGLFFIKVLLVKIEGFYGGCVQKRGRNSMSRTQKNNK